MMFDIRIVGLWLAIAVLVQAETQVCQFDFQCDDNLICGRDLLETGEVVRYCRCPDSYIPDGTGGCLPYSTANRICENDGDCLNEGERCTPNVQINGAYLSLCLSGSITNNATCRAGWDCPANQRCVQQQLSDDTFVGVCNCLTGFIFNEDRQECVQRPCEDWCVSSNSGDTCRNDQCFRCWEFGFFVCEQFLRPVDPPIIIIRRPSFFSVWMMSFFFITITLLMFSCVWKCCVTKRRALRPLPPQRTFSAETYVEQTAVERHQQDASVNIKMPLDTPLNAASLQSAQHPYDQPPPYATANAVRQA